MNTKALIEYLENKTAPYIVTIDGEWGAGKTRFIHNFIEKHKEQYKFIYCPLNGLSSIEQVEKQIIVSYENLGEKTFNLLTNTVFEILKQKYFLNVKKNNQFSKRFLLRNDTHLKDEIFKNFDHTVFIFDDVERYSGDLEELFGFILKFFELTEKKTILVGDFSKFDKKGKKIYDKRIINKITGLNLYVSSRPEEGFQNFLSLFEENQILLQQLKTTILHVFKSSGTHNLRALKSALIVLDSFLKTLREQNYHELLQNDLYTKDLAKHITAYTIEKMRLGMSMFDKDPEPKDKKEAKNDLDASLKKYNISKFIQSPIKEEEIRMLFQGNFKDINSYVAEIQNHQKYFPKQKLWQRLYNFRDLSDSEYEKYLEQLYKDFINLEVIDTFDFLHSVAILLYLKSEALLGEDFNAEIAISTFEKVKVQPKYTPRKFKRGGMHDASLGYVYWAYETEPFQDVYKHVITSDNKRVEEANIKLFLKNFSKFSTTFDEGLIKHYFQFVDDKTDQEFYNSPLLNLLPSSFYESVLELPTHVFYKVLRMMESRIDSFLRSEKEGCKILLEKFELKLKSESNARKKYFLKDFTQRLGGQIDAIENKEQTPATT